MKIASERRPGHADQPWAPSEKNASRAKNRGGRPRLLVLARAFNNQGQVPRNVRLACVSIFLQTLSADHADEKVCHRFEIDVACFVNRQCLAEEAPTRDAFSYGATSRRRLRSAAVQPIPCHVPCHVPCHLCSAAASHRILEPGGPHAWESSAKVPR